MIGTNSGRNLRREAVVVAVADFIRGDGVVFIDDGDHPETDQRFQRGAAVEVAAAVGTVFECDQNLRGGQTVGIKCFFISSGKTDLSNGGGGLRLFQRQNRGRKTKHATPKRDRAGRHEDHVCAPRLDPRHVLRQRQEPVAPQCTLGFVDQKRRPDFDNQSARVA